MQLRFRLTANRPNASMSQKGEIAGLERPRRTLPQTARAAAHWGHPAEKVWNKPLVGEWRAYIQSVKADKHGFGQKGHTINHPWGDSAHMFAALLS
jgi:hypothetical protein